MPIGLPVVAKIFPQVFPRLMGFPREVGRSGSAKERKDSFAKTCFDTSIGEWSAKTGNHPGSLLVFLALWYFDSSAHNPEVVGSSPASATKEPTRYLLWIPGFLRLYGCFGGEMLEYFKEGNLCFPYCFPYPFTALINCSIRAALAFFI